MVGTTDPERASRGSRMDIARLVIVLAVLVGLSVLLIAATHVSSGCGGG